MPALNFTFRSKLDLPPLTTLTQLKILQGTKQLSYELNFIQSVDIQDDKNSSSDYPTAIHIVGTDGIL